MKPEERFERIEGSLETAAIILVTLSANLVRYAEASDARMTRTEENLELLLRAITLEHSNGCTPEKP